MFAKILYVNGDYHGKDEFGKLMHDFKCQEPKDFYYSELADGVAHYKRKEGNENMCEAVEEYAMEVAKEYGERVRKAVTEEVTEEVTESVTKEMTEQAIRNLIEMGLEEDIAKENIIDRLIRKYQLTKEKAEEYYKKYE